MQGIDEQVVFGGLDAGGNPERKFSARIEPPVAARLSHGLAVAPVAGQASRLRGRDHQTLRQLEPEQGLPDWRDAVRVDTLLELRECRGPRTVDYPARHGAPAQAVPAAWRQTRAMGLVGNGLREGQADAEDGDAQAAAP